MSLNLTTVDAPRHEEWLPGIDVQLFESDRELTTIEGSSRYVVVVTGFDMTWAGLAQEDSMPLNGFDGTPEVVLEEENPDEALRILESLVNANTV